jgi:limonene-1,2-epoxide hydrolase
VRRDPATVIAAFIDAFNAEDLDALDKVLADRIEIQGSRGLIRGREEVRAWATRLPPKYLRQRLILDQVRADAHPPVALVRRQWFWHHSDEVADEQELAVLVTLDEDGLICRWQPFEDRAAALAAARMD